MSKINHFDISCPSCGLQQQVDLTPLGRLARPEDVAETVWAIATKLTLMTGNIVPVDGGRPLH